MTNGKLWFIRLILTFQYEYFDVLKLIHEFFVLFTVKPRTMFVCFAFLITLQSPN